MIERLPDMADPATQGPDAAAEIWLVRREAGADIESDPAFAAWLAAAPENVKAWASASAFWERLGAEASDPLVEAMRREALAARPPKPQVWPIAAGIAAAVGLALLTWTAVGPSRIGRPQQPWVAQTAQAAFNNPGRLPKTVSLADGSQVTLDGGAAIAVADAGPHRGARLLQGRAYFKVVHDPARPFRVEVGDRWISDLGTEFDVRLGAQAMTVTVAQGSVSVASPQAPKGVVAVAGQAVAVTSTGAVGPAMPADVGSALAWRSGMIEFHETPLAEAVRQMNQYGGAPLSLRDVDHLRVSGRFRVGDSKAFAHVLAEIYPLRAVDRPDGSVELVRKPGQ